MRKHPLSRDVLFCCVDDLFKCFWVELGKVGEDLAIKGDLRLLESSDEL